MKLRPIAIYPGGKRRFAKKIISKFPKLGNNIYYEPFIGMGAVFLELQPMKAVISDIDPDIVNIWKQLKNNPKLLIKHLSSFDCINKEMYLSIHSWMNAHVKTYSAKKAAYYILLTRFSYGGSLITKKDGYSSGFFLRGKNNYNVYKDIYHTSNILNVSVYLNNNDIEIYNKSYDKIRYSNKSLIYIDPPYEKRTNEKNLYRYNSHPDIIRFFKSKKNTFMSNSMFTITRYPELESKIVLKFKVQGFMNKTGKNDKKIRYECLFKF